MGSYKKGHDWPGCNGTTAATTLVWRRTNHGLIDRAPYLID
jgi:hypothetical protein